MQGTARELHALRSDLLEQRRRKMQACCWRGCRAFAVAVDRLVALAVWQFGMNIGWQRHFTQLGQALGDVPVEFKDSLAFFEAGDDSAANAIRQQQPQASANIAPADQRQPAAIGPLPQQQDLDLATAFCFGRSQPRRDNARVIEHQHIARPQHIGDIGKTMMRNRAAAASHAQQSGGIAWFCGCLRDKARRQVVIEICDIHSSAGCESSSAASGKGRPRCW